MARLVAATSSSVIVPPIITPRWRTNLPSSSRTSVCLTSASVSPWASDAKVIAVGAEPLDLRSPPWDLKM
eukprot:2534724-Prymnesium_polylepis.1